MKPSISAAACSIAFCTVLSACQQQTASSLPLGPTTLTGSLSPVELSLVRRGTHILRVDGNDVVYVESSTVNLREFEGMDVSVHGNLQTNTETKELPVLVADKISLVQEPSRTWDVSALKLSLHAPLTWRAVMFPDGVRFTEGASVDPLVQIIQSSLGALPAGTPMVIGGKQAVRTDSGSGQVIFVQNAKDVIAITISPTLSGATGKQPGQSVMRLLTSITFTTDSGSGTFVKFGSGATQGGTPCGGPAGILCPSGSFCSVTDRESNIGVCLKSR